MYITGEVIHQVVYQEVRLKQNEIGVEPGAAEGVKARKGNSHVRNFHNHVDSFPEQ